MIKAQVRVSPLLSFPPPFNIPFTCSVVFQRLASLFTHCLTDLSTQLLTHSFLHPCSAEAPSACSASGHRILDIHLLTEPGQLAREAGRPSLPRAGRQDGTFQGLRGPAPSAGWCLWDRCAVGKTKPSTLDRARVSPRPHHHGLSRIPLHRPLPGRVGHMHGLKWGGGVGPPSVDSRNRRVSQSQREDSQGSGALAYF